MNTLKIQKFKNVLTLLATFFLLFTLSLYSSSNENQLSSEELANIMLDPIKLGEMQKFVSDFDDVMNLIEYQNNIQLKINNLLNNEFSAGTISEELLLDKLKKIKKEILIEEVLYDRIFVEINTRSQSNNKKFNSIYKSNYNLLNDVYSHAKELSSNSLAQVKSLQELDYDSYDQLTAKSYHYTADFLLLMATKYELSRQLMPDFNLSKILIELDIIGARLLSDITRFNAFHIQSSSVNPNTIEKIHNGISQKYRNYEESALVIKKKTSLFFNELYKLFNENTELNSIKNSLDSLNIISLDYSNNFSILVESYVELADLYLEYKNDLDSIPMYRLNSINMKIESSRNKTNEYALNLNNTLIEFQNSLVILINKEKTK